MSERAKERIPNPGTTDRANALTQIVPNSSYLYTLSYSVIYNSVVVIQFETGQVTTVDLYTRTFIKNT